MFRTLTQIGLVFGLVMNFGCASDGGGGYPVGDYPSQRQSSSYTPPQPQRPFTDVLGIETDALNDPGEARTLLDTYLANGQAAQQQQGGDGADMNVQAPGEQGDPLAAAMQVQADGGSFISDVVSASFVWSQGIATALAVDSEGKTVSIPNGAVELSIWTSAAVGRLKNIARTYLAADAAAQGVDNSSDVHRGLDQLGRAHDSTLALLREIEQGLNTPGDGMKQLKAQIGRMVAETTRAVRDSKAHVGQVVVAIRPLDPQVIAAAEKKAKKDAFLKGVAETALSVTWSDGKRYFSAQKDMYPGHAVPVAFAQPVVVIPPRPVYVVEHCHSVRRYAAHIGNGFSFRGANSNGFLAIDVRN